MIILSVWSNVYSMVSMHIIEQCRSTVQSVCFHENVNTKHVKFILRSDTTNETRKYLTAICKDYEKFSTNIDGLNATSEPIKTELENSILKYKVTSYAKGYIAGALGCSMIPVTGLSTMHCCMHTIEKTINFAESIGDLDLHDTLQNSINLFFGSSLMWSGTVALGIMACALAGVAENNILENKKRLHANIAKNSKILKQCLQKEEL